VKKLVFAGLLALGLAFAATGTVQAGPLYRGVIYDPSYGPVVYIYNPSTGYVYLPQFNRGGYLPRAGGGYAAAGRAPAPRRSILSTRDVVGGSVGGGGYLSAGSGTSVTFGPGGPVYSSSR
jgi:hypothetical protein